MAEINLITTTRKYIDYTECNTNFLRRVVKQKKESQHVDIALVNKKIKSIINKFKSLSQSEMQEWKDIHMNKLRQLSAFLKAKGQLSNASSIVLQFSSVFRQQLHLMVEVCTQMKSKFLKTIVEYNSEELGQIIQQFYYRQYKDEILQIMDQAGYNTNRFRVLSYEQPSFFSFCCCWQPKFK